MPNQINQSSPSSHKIDEVEEAFYLFNYAKNLKNQLINYKRIDIVNPKNPLYQYFMNFLHNDTPTEEGNKPLFTRFLESKIISDNYKKDFMVDIALQKPDLVLDFIKFDAQELKRTTNKDTAVSAGKYLIKESMLDAYGESEPILINYIENIDQSKRENICNFLIKQDLFEYSYSRAIAETRKNAIKNKFARLLEECEQDVSIVFLPVRKYKSALNDYPKISTKEELETKIQFMNKLTKTPDNAEYLALYLCNKEENNNQKSLLAEIAGFGINKLGSSEQDILIGILNTVRTENGTLLDYYRQNSKDSEEIKAETLNKLQNFLEVGPKDKLKNMKETLEEKLAFAQRLAPGYSDKLGYSPSYLCNKEQNGNQKSLLAEIVEFEINNLEFSKQMLLKKILSNTTKCSEKWWTLLDYYSKNSTDSEEIKGKTLFYIQEFQYVNLKGNPRNTEEKLEKKLMFARSFELAHSDKLRYLVSYLCDKKENGGQKSLLAEIATFGIDRLEFQKQRYLKEFLEDKSYTGNGQTLLDYYSENSKDSKEIKAETLNKLQNFLEVGPRKPPPTRRVALPDLGLEMVFAVNNSDDTVKTPKDINKAHQESDTQTINKGNSGRSVY